MRKAHAHPTSAPLEPNQALPALEIARHIAKVSIENKAIDVRTVCLHHVTDIADYFVIASGTSDRHVKAIAEHIRSALAELGEKPINSRHFLSTDWVLLDYANVVVHIFHEPARQYYDFDKLWHKAQPVELDPELESQAKKLRTGMFSS